MRQIASALSMVGWLAAAGASAHPKQAISVPSSAAHFAYEISGDRVIRPIAVYDDGAHTYLKWSEAQPLPAVFLVRGAGNEEVVNGYMRGSVFTLDGVYQRLIFRIDSAVARAQRVRIKGR